MNKHFLQSKPWQQFQESLGRKTFHVKNDHWEYLAILEHGTGNSRLYLPYGPTAKDQTALEGALDSLKQLGKEQGVSFLRIEPTNPKFVDYLSKNGWKKVTYQSLNPEHTHLVDLSLSHDDLLASFVSNNRNLYRNYHKKGIKLNQSNDPKDISIFLDLIKKVASRTGMQPHSDEYFTKQAEALFPVKAGWLYYATIDSQPIAACIVYDSDTTRYFAHFGADDEFRKFSAGNVLVAHIIFEAQKKGLKTIDLYGVAPKDSSPTHPWFGFSKFKRSFGGRDADFAGSWELPIKPVGYWLYRLYQTARKKLR